MGATLGLAIRLPSDRTLGGFADTSFNAGSLAGSCGHSGRGAGGGPRLESSLVLDCKLDGLLSCALCSLSRRHSCSTALLARKWGAACLSLSRSVAAGDVEACAVIAEFSRATAAASAARRRSPPRPRRRAQRRGARARARRCWGSPSAAATPRRSPAKALPERARRRRAPLAAAEDRGRGPCLRHRRRRRPTASTRKVARAYCVKARGASPRSRRNRFDA